MNHIFPCSPQGGKISQLNPSCCIGKTGGTYAMLLAIPCKIRSQMLVTGLVGSQTHMYMSCRWFVECVLHLEDFRGSVCFTF